MKTNKRLYTISQQGWVFALTRESQKENQHQYHLKLAEIFEFRDGEAFRVAQHLLRAGKLESRERNQKILEILIASSGTQEGYLYTMGKNGPVLSAQCCCVGPPHKLNKMVREYIEAEMNAADDVTETGFDMNSTTGHSSDWTFQNGEMYQPIMLAHYTQEGYVINGLAILVRDPTKEFDYPTHIVTSVSKFLSDSEDIATLLLPSKKDVTDAFERL